jgi:hypothetical protein
MSTATTYAPPRQAELAVPNLPFIIAASSCGTLIEWYDFYPQGACRPSAIIG